VNGVSVGEATSYTFTNVRAPQTISATFAVRSYTITATAGAHGTITPGGAVEVLNGLDKTFTIWPAAHYHVGTLVVDGSAQTPSTSYTFTAVKANHTISATFASDTRTIEASAGPHGTITQSGSVAVKYGANQTFTITPAPHYHVIQLAVDGFQVTPVTSYLFANVTRNHTISATFAIDTYRITASAWPPGSISPSGVVSVNYWADQQFTITPPVNHHVADVLVDGVSVGAVTSYKFTNVAANHTISASFAIDTNIITASAGAHGTITPAGAVVVNYGMNQAFAITPVAHYRVADVVVDGVSQGALTSYKFSDVKGPHTISATFVPS